MKSNRADTTGDEDLKPGDVLFFKPSQNRSLGDAFISFAQRLRGLSHPEYVHAAICVGIDSFRNPIIVHFVNSGIEYEHLNDSFYNGHQYDVLRHSDEAKRQRMSGIAMEYHDSKLQQPGQPLQPRKKESNYSRLKMIFAFLRGNTEFPGKKERKEMAKKLFDKNKNEEVCSTFVASVAKEALGRETVSSSYLLPANLFENLEKSEQFSLEKMSADEEKRIQNQNLNTKLFIETLDKAIKGLKFKNFLFFGIKRGELGEQMGRLEFAKYKANLTNEPAESLKGILAALTDALLMNKGFNQQKIALLKDVSSQLIKEAVKSNVITQAQADGFSQKITEASGKKLASVNPPQLKMR